MIPRYDETTELEEAMERILIRYNVPSRLIYDNQIRLSVADRGDLASDLADLARDASGPERRRAR